MENRKVLITLGAVAVTAVVLIMHYSRTSPNPELGQPTDNSNGVVNPESAKAGLTTQSVPELSGRTFEPAPSAITGSYTEPVAEKAANTKQSAK